MGLLRTARHPHQALADACHATIYLDRRAHHHRRASPDPRPYVDGQRLRNRYLFTCVRRSKLLPFGGTQNRDVVELLGTRTREALTAARNIGQVGMTEAATRRWTGIYTALAVGAPGLLGEITNRAEAQVIRLALIYALLDRARQIDVVHLDAALAVWRFCEASARHIFGDTQGNPTPSCARCVRPAQTA